MLSPAAPPYNAVSLCAVLCEPILRTAASAAREARSQRGFEICLRWDAVVDWLDSELFFSHAPLVLAYSQALPPGVCGGKSVAQI